MTQISNAKVELAELFSFLASDREDVVKMAAAGVSQLSSDNQELNSFLIHGEAHIKALMDLLSVKCHQTLGDILTVFINCAADSSVADAFASCKVVQRVMRLLDGLEASDLSPNVLPAYKEMALMLLNNLTASTVVAIQDLLQVEDEELAGFFVSRLHSLYARQPEEASEEEDKPASSGRDLRKWFLQVCLNITRTPDGQKYLLSDDWPETLVAILKESPNPMLRLLVARTFKNCASVSANHKAIIQCGATSVILQRLHTLVEPEVTQLPMAEFLASMLSSEEGMNALEEVNTKKYLVSLCGPSTHGLVGQGQSSGVEELPDEQPVKKEEGEGQKRTVGTYKLAVEVKSFIEQSVLPYMDDVQDAYMMEE
eukprot:GILI01017813.1.p1 GENE.GILI01017813.1~~GILI01017813.1.p1  ORF type:complete len:370 (+),score=105.03 GILI01017813.1:58-1167(+)